MVLTLCPHFGTCGGCSLQDMPPADYAAVKRAAVQNALIKAGVTAEVLAPIIVPPRSRRRAVFKIKSLPKGLHIGFHAAKSHTVIDMHHCDVLTPALFALVSALRQRLEPLFGVGEAGELHVTESDTGFDCALRWRAGLTPALTAALATALSGLGIARLTMGRDTVFETAMPTVTLGGVPVKLPPDAGTFERQLYRINVTRAQMQRLNATLSLVPYRKPVIGEVEFTSGFGVRSDPFLGRPAMHTGLDFRAATGDPVRATANGKVIASGWMGGYGRMVEIDHGNGLSTRYGHLSEIHVKIGDVIKIGQVIGAVGSTGRSTGPHLHYETRIDGDAVDPQKFLRAGVRLSAG